MWGSWFFPHPHPHSLSASSFCSFAPRRLVGASAWTPMLPGPAWWYTCCQPCSFSISKHLSDDSVQIVKTWRQKTIFTSVLDFPLIKLQAACIDCDRHEGSPRYCFFYIWAEIPLAVRNGCVFFMRCGSNSCLSPVFKSPTISYFRVATFSFLKLLPLLKHLSCLLCGDFFLKQASVLGFCLLAPCLAHNRSSINI